MKAKVWLVSVCIACGTLFTCIPANAGSSATDCEARTEAFRTHDTPEQIRSLISRMKEQLEKDTDAFPALVKEAEQEAAQCTDSIGVAVLHSMIAEMYRHYYRSNSWRINQRTEIVDYVPDDMREWSASLFNRAITTELERSLQPAKLLQQMPVSRYAALLKAGKDDRQFRPTMYDFLAYRAIEIQPEGNWFEPLLAFRRTQPEQEACLFAELEYRAGQYERRRITAEAYSRTLDSLAQSYRNEPHALLLQTARLELLERTRYEGDKAQRDSVDAKIYRLCKETVARFPHDEYANRFRNTLKRMEKAVLDVQAPRNVYPGMPLVFRLWYTHMPQITIRVYKSLRRPEQALQNLYNKSKQMRGALVKEQTFRLYQANTYSNHDTTLMLPIEEPLGLYEYEITTPYEDIRSSARFSISRLAALMRRGDNLPEVFVTDLKSGKPIEGAKVLYYKLDGTTGDLQLQGSVATDRFGIALLPKRKGETRYSIRPIFGNDTASFVSNLSAGTSSPQREEQTRLSLFTDRGIYRPGQTVFFKGIAYVNDAEHPYVVPNQRYTLSLRDMNGKEISNRTFTTNRFGSFNGEFTLPAQTADGIFRIFNKQCQSVFSFRVEAYKRPSFKLDFLPINEEVAFGHPVELKGKATGFSGVTMQDGEVKWIVTRRPFRLRSYMYHSTEQVAAGTSRLDSQGNFTVAFTPERPETPDDSPTYQTYEIRATLTDSKGETQERSYTFSVGETGILLSIRTDKEEMDKTDTHITITAQTINGEPTTAQGNYTLYALSDKAAKKDVFGRLVYSVEKQIAVGSFTAGKQLAAEPFRTLPSGRYRIEAKATDAHGKEVTTEQDFILYGSDDACPPVFSHLWFVPKTKKINCLPGEEAEFVFGTSDHDTHVLYEIYNEHKERTKRELLRFDNECRTFRIPFQETDGKGFTVSFTFVKEGELYEKKVPVYLRQSDRKLTIRTVTFRDRMLPGSNEQWTFRLTDADSAAVTAEVLASMYDASLDRIYPSRWDFVPEYPISLPVPYFYTGSMFGTGGSYDSGKIKFLPEPSYAFNRLDWQNMFDLDLSVSSGSRYLFSMKAAGSSTESEFYSIQEDAALLSEPPVIMEVEGIESERNTVTGSTAEEIPVPLREHFAETTFFYPVLVTDTAGRVSFRFTMPESNTTWKLRLSAHTKELKYGYLEKEVVTSKPLMVTPNLPRFLREGDEASLTTQISNLTGETVTGDVRFELFDPITGARINLQTESHKTVSLPASETKSTDIRFRVPSVPQGVIGCRIVAETDKGSDGEQHLIPVLPNEILVTESTPFHLFDQTETTVRLQSDKHIRPFRTTLELTANPIWYAVQALPTLAEPGNDNAVSWFAAYYSSTLAQYIANAHPRIRQVVEQWKTAGGDTHSLLSRLETDTELKNIVQEETPWLLEAENETEQIRRLSLLFDLNRTAGLRATALRQLLDLQRTEGGWSWFKGMRPSEDITLYILRGMSQLTELNAVEYNQEEKEMQMRALQFLDKQVARQYREENKHVLTARRIDYLFVRSAYRDVPKSGDTHEAIRCYTALAEQQWEKQSLYRRGEIAWLMHRNGNKPVAKEILTWLRKTATESDSEGMYWANNRQGDGSFLSPLDTHCLFMTLFNELDPDKQEIDRMKQWLLSRKQTQHWGTIPATVQAVYALLLTGSDRLATDNRCVVTWGKRTYDTVDGEIGTGYLKVTLSNEQAAEAAGSKMVVRKEGNAPAWGAVYEQYFQPISDVKKKKGVLHVEKKLFIETNDGKEAQLRPVGEGEALHVGDKAVVRLVVRTDRTMDYVFLKDLRAGCMEPTEQFSGTRSSDGIRYYQSPTDVAEHFFFDRLPKGTFVLEYRLYVSRPGTYAGGISTIQCLYAPEFVAHTEGRILQVR